MLPDIVLRHVVVAPLERPMPRYHHEHDHAQRPHVHRLVILSSSDHLGSHELCSSARGAGLPRGRVVDTRQVKVEDLEPRVGVFGLEYEVGGLEVAMCDVHAVKVLHALWPNAMGEVSVVGLLIAGSNVAVQKSSTFEWFVVKFVSCCTAVRSFAADHVVLGSTSGGWW